jgi:hypothetical protein
MDAEAARVQLKDLKYLETRSKLMLLIDEWEDVLRRSLYGFVVAEVKEQPVVLTLEDFTGERATAEGLKIASVKALEEMDLKDAKKLIAVTTDNPTVMVLYRKKMVSKFHWLLVRDL